MTKSVDASVGEQVRLARQEAGLDLAACAKFTGLTVPDFADHELGKRRFKTAQLFSLAQRFSIPVATFFKSIDCGQLPLTNLVILLMEGDKQQRELLSSHLERQGGEVVAVANLRAALVALERFRFSVAVLQEVASGTENSDPFDDLPLEGLPIIVRSDSHCAGPLRAGHFGVPRDVLPDEIVALLKGVICGFGYDDRN